MRFLTALFLCFIAMPALADGLTIERVSTLETVQALPTAGVFLIITNDGPADKLIGVKSTVGDAMMHSSEIDEKGVMVMRPQSGFDIVANGTFAMAPGGNHIMLTNLKQQMVKGTTFPLTLQFEKAGTKDVGVEVVSADDMADRFPPELVGASIEKMMAVKKRLGQTGKEETVLDRLRTKIQKFFSKDKQVDGMPDAASLPTREEMEKRSAFDMTPSGARSPVPVPATIATPVEPLSDNPIDPSIPTVDAPSVAAPAPVVPAPANAGQ